MGSEYDLSRWRDAAGDWHLRFVPRHRGEGMTDEHFEACLGYVRFLLQRGLIRFDVEGVDTSR